MTNKQRQKAMKQADKNIAARKASTEPKTETKSTNVVDFPESTPVSSETETKAGTVNSVAGENIMTLTATRINPDRKGSSLVFKLSNGFTLKGPQSAFGANPAKDASFTIEAPEGLFSTGRVAKAKMTKEERAAARAAMTPQDKAKRAAEIAQRAAARAAKLAAAAGVA